MQPALFSPSHKSRAEGGTRCPRVSDEDLLKSILHDLAAVYTDVLRTPIPGRVAAVLSSLETALQPSNTLRV